MAMKYFRLFLLTGLFSGFVLADSPAERALDNPIFCFNNALNKRGLAPIPLAQQAALLEKLGYHGMEARETADLLETVGTFKQHGLAVPADYLEIDLDSTPPYEAAWKSVLPRLKGTGMILWVHIHSAKFKPSDEAADEIIVPILRELAGFAAPVGVRVAIYPHVGFVAQTAADSARLARKAERENIGSVFNLCHFLKTESAESLEKALDDTLPTLFAASISGADRGDTREMGWDRLIQPLGKGSFDVYRVVAMLADKGFTGPVGVQCYNLKGDPEAYLSESITAWNGFKARYARPPNTETP